MCDICYGMRPAQCRERRCLHHSDSNRRWDRHDDNNSSNCSCRHNRSFSSRASVAAGMRTRGRGQSPNNAVTEALFGGFVAGIFLGGPLGGVLGGLAAAGTATVVGQRSNSDPRADDAIDGDGGGAGCCTDDTVAAPFMTATVSFSATNPSSTVTEEAMVETGRIMALGERVTMARTVPARHAEGEPKGSYDEGRYDSYDRDRTGCRGRHREDSDGRGDGQGRVGSWPAGDDGVLPAAKLVNPRKGAVQAIRIPCGSMSSVAHSELTAVTATPAADDVSFNMPLELMMIPSNSRAEGRGGLRDTGARGYASPELSSALAPPAEAAAAAAAAAAADEATPLAAETENNFLARITRSAHHHLPLRTRYMHPPPTPTTATSGGGATCSSSLRTPPQLAVVPLTAPALGQEGPVSVDFEVALRAGAHASSSSNNNNNVNDHPRQQQQAVEIVSYEQGTSGEDGNVDGDLGVGGGEEVSASWWAGGPFENDWGCVFDAYVCQHREEIGGCDEGDGRLPCVAAREPLQGSGVGGRIARRVARIADWHENGSLDRDEFALAMYLCRRHRQGDGVPSTLESWMLPPRLRETRGCTPDNPCPALRRRWW